MVISARCLKMSLGISSSFGLLGVGITMPKSVAFPSNFAWTVKVSFFSWGSQVMKVFCPGWLMSRSLAEKKQQAALTGPPCPSTDLASSRDMPRMYSSPECTPTAAKTSG